MGLVTRMERWGTGLSEPTTTLTDYLIAVVALIFAGSLWRSGWLTRQRSIQFWALAFVCVALAAGLGGTGHGFVHQLPAEVHAGLWKAMLIVLSFASCLMLIGTIFSCIAVGNQRKWLLAVLGKSSLIWAILMQTPQLGLPQFGLAVVDYGSALVMVLGLQSCAQIQHRRSRVGWLVAGIGASGLAIGILGSRLTLPHVLHPMDLNQVDLYHLVQLVGLGLLYQSARQLQDRTS